MSNQGVMVRSVGVDFVQVSSYQISEHKVDTEVLTIIQDWTKRRNVLEKPGNTQ